MSHCQTQSFIFGNRHLSLCRAQKQVSEPSRVFWLVRGCCCGVLFSSRLWVLFVKALAKHWSALNAIKLNPAVRVLQYVVCLTYWRRRWAFDVVRQLNSKLIFMLLLWAHNIIFSPQLWERVLDCKPKHTYYSHYISTACVCMHAALISTVMKGDSFQLPW